MKTFQVSTSNGNYLINLPTDIKEITSEYLTQCVEHINPAPEYSVVAVIYKEALNVILNTFKNKKNPTISIVPKFIKRGTTDSEFIKSINCGDTIVVSGSDISLGHHISSPVNRITIDKVVQLCANDKEVWTNSLSWNDVCYFVEFKLIPNCNIHGIVYDNENETAATTFIKKVPRITIAEA